MATMWPRQLPLSVRSDERRRAEVRTYDRLAAVLDDDFTVFYSSPWLGTDEQGAEKDGECDFLVAHSRLGYVALEVKGGGISYDPELDQWKSRDRHGLRHNIRDPVGQARAAKHEILRRLKDSARWRTRFIHIAHGVIFPDASSPPGDLGADRPAKIFCCSGEFARDLRGWIGRRLQEDRRTGCEPLGEDGIAAITRILAAPFHLGATLSASISDAAEQLGVLEPTQFHILDHIADIARAEIRGGAGTGKTVIAAEEAVRLAGQGVRTLLTCHSGPLAAELGRRLGGIPNLTVASFHSLCGRLAAKAGIAVTGSGPSLYSETLPSALMEAARALPAECWDAIIVDEGQDFQPSWWIALTDVLAPGGRLRVMSDSNQRIYDSGRVPGMDLELVPIRLTRNLRNSRPICEAATVHYRGPDLTAAGPPEPAVHWVAAEDETGLAAAAAGELRRLVHGEEVAPMEIAVLVPSSDWIEQFRRASARSGLEFVEAGGLRSDAVVLDTVRRFKGLERQVVILLVASCDMLECELAYVGFTRPRAFLSVVSTAAQQPWLRGQVG